jgi:hypothetical protein
MIVEFLRGLGLMVALYEPEFSVCRFYVELTEVIDRALGVTKPAVLSAALDLLLLLHEAMVEVSGKGELPVGLGQFVGAYRGKLGQVPGLATKKADVQALTKQCALVGRVFEGEQSRTEIVLNNQVVPILGRRKQAMVGAVRRITGSHFQEQMAGNVMVHALLGVELMSQNEALRTRRQMKPEIEHNRVSGKKERQKAIDKKRKQREDQADVDEDW